MEEQTPVPGNSAGKSARLSDLCLVGGLLLLILVQEAAVSYAVQLWENGPDGPRLSQCPRTPKKPDADRDTARTTAP